MPTHPRTTVRKSLVAKLLAANTAAGTKIYDSLYWPTGDEEAPAVIVYTNDDSIHEDSATPDGHVDLGLPIAQRGVLISIMARVASKVDPQGELDSLLREIEQAIHADRTLSGSVEYITYVATTAEGIEGSSPQAIEAEMTWLAVYIDDFL